MTLKHRCPAQVASPLLLDLCAISAYVVAPTEQIALVSLDDNGFPEEHSASPFPDLIPESSTFFFLSVFLRVRT